MTLRYAGMTAGLLALAILAEPAVTAQGKGARLNSVIRQYEAGKVAFVETDWAWINMEETWNVDRLKTLLTGLKKGAGAPPISPVVRVPSGGAAGFGQYVDIALNLGLANIVIPKIETAAEAQALVKQMRYAEASRPGRVEPRGERRPGVGQAAAYWGVSEDEYRRKADLWPLNPDGELVAIAMIESKASVDNIADILAVEGLGAILVGPYDLGQTLGVGPPRNGKVPPETEAAIQTVRKACLAAKKVICGIAGVDSTNRDARVAEGWHMMQVLVRR